MSFREPAAYAAQFRAALMEELLAALVPPMNALEAKVCHALQVRRWPAWKASWPLTSSHTNPLLCHALQVRLTQPLSSRYPATISLPM